MSRLSPALKTLITAPSAFPNPIPAPRGIGHVYESISRDASQHGVSPRAWICIAVCSPRVQSVIW